MSVHRASVPAGPASALAIRDQLRPCPNSQWMKAILGPSVPTAWVCSAVMDRSAAQELLETLGQVRWVEVSRYAAVPGAHAEGGATARASRLDTLGRGPLLGSPLRGVAGLGLL